MLRVKNINNLSTCQAVYWDKSVEALSLLEKLLQGTETKASIRLLDNRSGDPSKGIILLLSTKGSDLATSHINNCYLVLDSGILRVLESKDFEDEYEVLKLIDISVVLLSGKIISGSFDNITKNVNYVTLMNYGSIKYIIPERGIDYIEYK